MTDEEIINTYKLYLNKRENIPLGYLTNHNISLYVDYLLTKIKKCKTNDNILKVYSKKLLIDYGLRHILDIYNDLYDIIQIVYPNRFKKWEIKDKLSTYDIDKYGLGSLFINVFNHSKNSLIKTLYPDYK